MSLDTEEESEGTLEIFKLLRLMFKGRMGGKIVFCIVLSSFFVYHSYFSLRVNFEQSILEYLLPFVVFIIVLKCG